MRPENQNCGEVNSSSGQSPSSSSRNALARRSIPPVSIGLSHETPFPTGSFRKRSNGRVLQFDQAIFFTLHEGRLVRVREIVDSFDMVQQVLEQDLSGLLATLLPRV